MKKNLTILLIIFGLTAIGYLGYTNAKSKSSSYDTSDREFAVENTDLIHKIKMTHRTGKFFQLTRNDDHWLVGDDKRANQNIVNNILSVIQNIQLKYIPPREYSTKIINEVNRIGVQVDLYDKNDKLIKSYFVGGNVADGGTYYVMQGKNTPFVMERKVFFGGVRDLFMYDEFELYDRTIAGADPEKIVSLTVDYKKDKPNSFRLVNNKGVFAVDPLHPTTRRMTRVLNQGVAKAYLSGFDKVVSEANDNDSEIVEKIKAIIPFAELSYTLENGKSTNLKFYPVNQFKKEQESLTAIEKLNLNMVERFFVLTQEGDLYIAQKILIKKLFRGYPYFFE